MVLHLERAEAFEVLSAMKNLAGEPVLIDAAASMRLRCASVTVNVPDRVPRSTAVELIASALRAQGYRADRVAGQWVISFDPAAPPPSCGPVEPPEPPAAPPTEEIARSIRRVSATEYVITRRGRDLILEHATAITQGARIVPERQGDRIAIRLAMVRRNETLERLGLRIGDRLERILGYELNDPQQALSAYADLRKADRAELTLVRDGAQMKILYRVE